MPNARTKEPEGPSREMRAVVESRGTLTPGAVLQLQRLVGNRAAGDVVRARAPVPHSTSTSNGLVQAKVDGNGMSGLWVFQSMKFWAALSNENKSYFEAWLRHDKDYTVGDFLKAIESDLSEKDATELLEEYKAPDTKPTDVGKPEEPPPERQTGLMKQVGPNCWIFVLQAILEGIKAKEADHLGQVLMGAPSEEQMEESGFGKGSKGRRKQSMKLMFVHMGKFDSVVKQVPRSKLSLSYGSIKALAELAGIAESARFAKYIFMSNQIPLDSEIAKAPLLKHIAKSVSVAAKLETYLRDAVSENDSNAEANALLGGTGASVGKVTDPQSEQDQSVESQLGDVRLALEQVKFPAYAGIRARYKLTTKLEDKTTYKYQAKVDAAKKSGVIDLTDQPINEMQSTTHAVLLKKWEGEHVFYQDPNYPKYPIKLTLQQTAAMAGDSLMEIRSVLKENKLEDLVSKPT